MALFDYERANIKKVLKLAQECTLFLKRNGDFPLKSPCNIALYGSGARHTIKGGTGSGEVNSRFSISIEKGLEMEGFKVMTKDWLDAYDHILSKANEKFYKDIRTAARKKHTLAAFEGMGKIMAEPEYNLPVEKECEVAVYVLSRISGEGSDREPKKGEILLSDTEVKDILKLNEIYDRFMLVLNTGGPVDLTPVAGVDNILLLSQLGVIAGKTLAKILLGKHVPSGKLATTWSKWEDYCTVGDFGAKDDTYYKEGIYVGYRYFDTVGKKADYPFGFGLGYTDFSVKPCDVSVNGADVEVKARVQNIGSYKGKEVVQVYVSVPAGELDQPFKTLAGFTKTGLLKPSEEEIVVVRFKLTDIAGFEAKLPGFVLEAGEYVVRVGNSSVDTQVAAVLELKETVVTRKVKSCLGEAGFEDYKPECVKEPIPADAKRITIDAGVIETEVIAYDRAYEIAPEVASYTDEQLAYLSVGAFNPKGGFTSVIGNAGMKVAGAAGESANPFNDPDYPVLVMSDGPAGVRISKKYTVDEDGKAHPIGIGLPDSMMNLMPKPVAAALKFKAGLDSKKQVNYHYATAIPIGTALAQSFNLELARECGDIVGGEMERFGVHLWLAPALNIHRSIRCGRNFEYFSEDPLVSGRFAAALTLGVQAHKGCGTTIKHYAANNQETNRYNNNSNVSERAMREIYLKGFEICVKEAKPLSVMTSYNLLNGEHTSESRDLIENLLRAEYGFEGMVMTDWIVDAMMDKRSLHRGPRADLVAKAGGDLVMPGSMGDVEKITNALNNGEITREQLMINVSRIYRLAKKCNDR